MLVLGTVLMVSCSNYQKVVKGNNYEEKHLEADRMFEKGSFTKSLTLYEQIYQRYPKTKKGRKSYYRMAEAYFAIENYYMGGYYYNQYTVRYPSNEKTDDASFMKAICSVKNSPAVTLDQDETQIALNDLQSFVQRYPESTLVDSCNRTMDRLRLKLETKRFNAVQLYDKMEKYRAAVASSKSFLTDYPRSDFIDEATRIQFVNSYELAKRSVLSKKKQRIENALELYTKYINYFKGKSYQNKMEKYKKDLDVSLVSVQEQYTFNEIVEAYEQSRTDSKSKKTQYLKETLKRYDNFVKKYPASGLLEKAKSYKEKAEKELLNS